MSDTAENLYTSNQVFPKYVTDSTLKRARVDTSDGPAIRIKDSNEVNLDEIESRMGAKSEAAWSGSGDGSIISILKRIASSF